MAHTIPFDTLAFAKELEIAGVPPPQAEAQAKALSGVLQNFEASRLEELATKRDIKELEIKIEAAKAEAIKWTAGMFAAQSALIIGAMFAMIKTVPPPAAIMPPQPPAQEWRQPGVPLKQP